MKQVKSVYYIQAASSTMLLLYYCTCCNKLRIDLIGLHPPRMAPFQTIPLFSSLLSPLTLHSIVCTQPYTHSSSIDGDDDGYGHASCSLLPAPCSLLLVPLFAREPKQANPTTLNPSIDADFCNIHSSAAHFSCTSHTRPGSRAIHVESDDTYSHTVPSSYPPSLQAVVSARHGGSDSE